MDLLSKFDAVTIQADSRITENDRDYCIAHQKHMMWHAPAFMNWSIYGRI